jgi:hypothetical protein
MYERRITISLSGGDKPSHLRLIESDICPRRDLCFLPFGIREKFPGFLLAGFSAGSFLGLLFSIDAKETVYRVLATLAEVIFFVLAFAALGNMGWEEMRKMDLPEFRIDLSFIKEFFHMPWRVFHP